MVTAQVDGIEPSGLVVLTVLACEILYSKWEPLKPFQRGEKIRRKRETFAKGDASSPRPSTRRRGRLSVYRRSPRRKASRL